METLGTQDVTCEEKNSSDSGGQIKAQLAGEPAGRPVDATNASVMLANIHGAASGGHGRGMHRRQWIFTALGLAVCSLVTALVLETIHYWPSSLALRPPGGLQRIEMRDGHWAVTVTGRSLVGELATFDDGFFAYLMFDYYRSLGEFEGRPVMLVSDEKREKTTYRILVKLPNDLIEGISELAESKRKRLTSTIEFEWILPAQLGEDFHQTALFMESYEGPVPKTIENLHGLELRAYVRRFIRFKSITDPRIRQNLQPIPSPLTRKEASRLAADMIAVSKFYRIPLDLLIGIGAMENNFMNVPGDETNTLWKRHAQPGDIVLKRRHGRVLVRDDSSGVWQITRHSLRYAHRLYLADKRDYSQLPARLQPPKKLDVNNVSSDVLTTYAGILLRDLLDQFQGNVALAAGAYNGGVKNPNAHYAAGVEMVADYARRIIDRAAALNDQAVSQTSVSQKAVKRRPRESVEAEARLR